MIHPLTLVLMACKRLEQPPRTCRQVSRIWEDAGCCPTVGEVEMGVPRPGGCRRVPRVRGDVGGCLASGVDSGECPAWVRLRVLGCLGSLG